jgi:Ni2+-binding GTPase involved in maturation of urease and hydrogenase
MQLHLVGGFLGSGKTTAIIGAARLLLAQGRRVGVVTNDQGRYLVDTAFFQSTLPTVEVAGGCFCCNYGDLQARLDQLKAIAQPDVIFAESVGSCADMVATVLKPLLTLRSGSQAPASFSVFADSRLLRLRLAGEPLPFSEDVVYIFDKQLEEAGLLVMNKIDLLSLQAGTDLVDRATQHFPGKILLRQNSLEPASLVHWLDLISSGAAPLPEQSLQIDYQRYAEGEARLAWLDEEINLKVPTGKGQDAVRRLLSKLLAELQQEKATVGHLKILLRAGEVEVKVSIPTLQEEGWPDQVPGLPGERVFLMLNARVAMNADRLRSLVRQVLEQVVPSCGGTFTESGVAYFHPSFPRPTYRIG